MKTELVAGLRWWEFSSADGNLGAGESNQDRLQDDVEDRDKEQVEDGGKHHAADDGSTDGVTTVGSGTGREVKRTDAKDEGDGGHQNGAEAEFGSFDGGLGDGSALSEELLREFDDENRVLC